MPKVKYIASPAGIPTDQRYVLGRKVFLSAVSACGRRLTAAQIYDRAIPMPRGKRAESKIGAAMAVYGKKTILLVERGVTLPTNPTRSLSMRIRR
jgi:hypothetical protein